MKSIYRFLIKINVFGYIFISLVITYGVNFITMQIPIPGNLKLPPEVNSLSPILFFSSVVIIGPFFETLIYQGFLIGGLMRVLKNVKLNNRHFLVLFSSLVFGLSHGYNIRYMFVAFFMGIILGYVYVIGQKRKENGIVLVTIVHSLYNSNVLF